jgi:hypothetical protein
VAAYDNEYWAGKPASDAVKEVYRRIDNYYQWLRLTGTYDLWVRSVQEYYAGYNTRGQLGVTGEADEYLTSKENHLHNIGENIVIMTTGSRPSFEPKAKNSDHSSAAQTIIAAGLLDNAHREKDLEGIGIQVVRDAGCLFGEGVATVLWDSNAGQDFTRNPDTGKNEKTGDIKLRRHMAIDTARDHTKTNPDDHIWYAVRTWENRYDLAETRPEMRATILGLPSRYDESAKRPTLTRDWKGIVSTDSDDVAVWDFFHADTPGLPGGRRLRFCAEDCIIFEGPLPMDELPVYRMTSEDMVGTQLGYAPLFDLLAPQHVVNSLDSTITSAIANVGYGSVWVKAGDNLDVESVTGNLKMIRSANKPEPLNLLEIPQLVNEYKNQKIAGMEAISGVNSARRGTLVNEKAMSGAALALVDAKAIEYSKGLERGYVKWLERMATAIIRAYRRYAKVPQVALVAGKANRSYMKQFTGADLDRIERVTVDLGSPLARTVSGRMNLAQMFLGMVNPKTGDSVIKTPDQLVQVLNTGRLEPVIEATTAELMNIRAENERLSDGKPCHALISDNHPLHIREHLITTNSPEARESAQPGPDGMPGVTPADVALEHVQEHMALWSEAPPALLAALGVPPPPMPVAPVPPPGAVDGGGGGPVPPGQPQPDGAVPAPGGMGDALQGSMPQMPKSPLTGERAEYPMPGA